MFIRQTIVNGLVVAALGFGLVTPKAVPASSIDFSSTAPVFGPNDAYQSVGSGDSGTPIGPGGGASKDQYRFVSSTLGAQGQVFTVPGTGLFQINAITIQEGQIENANVVLGTPLQIRINAVSGTSLTPLDTELINLPTGQGNFPDNGYMTFHLSTPVLVTGGSTYGFDVWSSSTLTGAPSFFAVNGATTTDSVGVGLPAGGGAYTSGSLASPTPSSSIDTLSAGFNRSFDVSMSAASVPEPASVALLGFGAVLVVGAARRGRHLHRGAGGEKRV